jgi:HK97 family phage prohead protease
LPIPVPNKNENHDDFIGRCMADETMQEYDNKQRYAICQAGWDKNIKERSKENMENEVRTVISYNAAHGKIGYSEDSWDGPKNRANLKNDETGDYYRKAFTYRDPEADPDTKTAYKFIHHMVDSDGSIGLANLRACSAGIAVLNGGRGGTDIPKNEYQGVYDHLAHHLRDADREAPELKRTFKNTKYETRTINLANINAEEKIYAKIASFNSLSQELYGSFYESISPGAFTKTLQEADIRALVNHNENYVLGRLKSGTIKLDEREDGLYMECNPPDTQWAKDLMTSIKRGDIDQCSFGFRVIKDSYAEEDGKIIRTLHEVELYDVSIVTYPAYINTNAAVRNLLKRASRGEISHEVIEEHLKLLLEPEKNHSKNQPNEPSFNKTLVRQRELQLLEAALKLQERIE